MSMVLKSKVVKSRAKIIRLYYRVQFCSHVVWKKNVLTTNTLTTFIMSLRMTLLHEDSMLLMMPTRMLMSPSFCFAGGEVKKVVGLVGKGLTFDSGGYNLKVGGMIEMMKFDMGGAGAVLGAALAISKIKPPGVEVREGQREGVEGGIGKRGGGDTGMHTHTTRHTQNTHADTHANKTHMHTHTHAPMHSREIGGRGGGGRQRWRD